METEEVIVSNPLWLKLAIIFGVILLSILGFFMIWQAFDIKFTPITKSLVFVGMGLFILFVVLKGLPLLKYISHSLLLNENGIEIQKGKISKVYAWNDIGAIKGSDTFQVLRIYDSSGKIIYAVDYYAKNFYEFMAAISADA
jgi:phosphatidylglycerophosphate synthase